MYPIFCEEVVFVGVFRYSSDVGSTTLWTSSEVSVGKEIY